MFFRLGWGLPRLGSGQRCLSLCDAQVWQGLFESIAFVASNGERGCRRGQRQWLHTHCWAVIRDDLAGRLLKGHFCNWMRQRWPSKCCKSPASSSVCFCGNSSKRSGRIWMGSVRGRANISRQLETGCWQTGRWTQLGLSGGQRVSHCNGS